MLKVRTAPLDETSSIAVVDFRFSNPSNVNFVVRTVTVVLESACPLHAASAAGQIKTISLASGRRQVRWTFRPEEGKLMPLSLTLSTGPQTADLDVWYFTNEDPRPRALPLHRLLLPWAVLKKPKQVTQPLAPELKGGDWARGKQIFFGDKAGCARTRDRPVSEQNGHARDRRGWQRHHLYRLDLE